MKKSIYSVGQVNNYIKNMFAQDFMLHHICVKGEVSNCKYHSSGHIYFTLKDSMGTISAIMFAGNRKGLTFSMKEGDRVIVTGSVEVYERDGKYQLYAREIELDGEGNLFLKFEALKKELEEMGMFAPEYKQPIPKYIKRLGIVTAATGAAIQDIRNVASRRNPYIQLILYPAQVQGEGAAESIVRGILALEAIGVDTIIVGRGGGSIEDLWAFNEECVARAIFDCSIPIISAVGHETDWTIADFVSDMRAPTPSAAAELAVYDYQAVAHYLNELKLRMRRILMQQTTLTKSHLAHLRTRLLLVSPKSRLNENRKRTLDNEEKLLSCMSALIKEKRHMLTLLTNQLESNSPMKQLSCGYAYVEGSNQKALRSVASVKPNDEIQIYLKDGTMKAIVAEVNKHE